jgi:single-stranded DNA-binding protein
MRDQNFLTIGGRVTHAPGIYSTNNQGFLLSFSIANHSNYPAGNSKPLFLEVKVADASNRTKLEEFAKRLPVGRKVCIHNGELQMKEYDGDGERKRTFHVFCRLDQIWLHDLPAKHDNAVETDS